MNVFRLPGNFIVPSCSTATVSSRLGVRQYLDWRIRRPDSTKGIRDLQNLIGHCSYDGITLAPLGDCEGNPNTRSCDVARPNVTVVAEEPRNCLFDLWRIRRVRESRPEPDGTPPVFGPQRWVERQEIDGCVQTHVAAEPARSTRGSQPANGCEWLLQQVFVHCRVHDF